MRSSCLFYALLLLVCRSLFAQDAFIGNLTGVYRVKTDPAIEFRVSRKDDQLLLQILGQGRTVLTPASGGRYALKGVRPAAFVEFLRNDSGQIDRCRVTQDEPPYTWKKIGDTSAGFTGAYQLTGNPYRVFHIREKEGQSCSITSTSPFFLRPGPSAAAIPSGGGP